MRSWVARAAAALIALHLAIRAVLAFGGYFYWDDLILVGRAGTQGLLSPGYLFDDHDGHVMPGAFLVAGVITRLAPLDWLWPAISLVVLQLLASLALLRALHVILGWRPVLLVPLTFALVHAAGRSRLRLVGGRVELTADAGRDGVGVRRRDSVGAHRQSALCASPASWCTSAACCSSRRRPSSRSSRSRSPRCSAYVTGDGSVRDGLAARGPPVGRRRWR